MTARKTFTKRDIWVLAGLVLFAAAFALVWRFAVGGRGVLCEVRVDGALVRTVSLDKDVEFTLDERPHIHFQVRDGAIAFVESDCPDQICVKSGFLGRVGQSAACLPNGVTISVAGSGVGGDGDELDVVAQ